jgi:hypothetical protein
MVGGTGFEPVTPSMSITYTTIGLVPDNAQAGWLCTKNVNNIKLFCMTSLDIRATLTDDRVNWQCGHSADTGCDARETQRGNN